MYRQRLLLAVSAEVEARALENAFHGLEEIELIGTVDDGAAVVQTILDERVDILVMEIMLKQFDGLQVLDSIRKMPAERHPLKFLISPYTDDRLLRPWINQVVYCFIKPYQPETVVLRVLQMATESEQQKRAQPNTCDSASLLERRITKSILSIGIPAHQRGYYMLRDAIRIYAQSDNPSQLRITIDVYPRLAQVYECHSKLVEHAIRSSIEYAWIHGNLEVIHELFGYSVNDVRGKPGNAEFVMLMAEHVRIKPTRGFMELKK